jgi:hypothetical protein
MYPFSVAKQMVAQNLYSKLIEKFQAIGLTSFLWLDVPQINEVEAVEQVQKLNLEEGVVFQASCKRHEDASSQKENHRVENLGLFPDL